MKIFTIAFAVLLSSSAWAQSDGTCGPTVQTFWTLQKATKKLKLRAIYRHSETEYCERSMLDGGNADIKILDKNKRLLRSYRTYVPLDFNQDQMVQDQMASSLISPKQVSVQLKFAQDAGFKRASYISIQFVDGSLYGPAPL